jgi:DNA-3-methyladenine glycosylase
MEDSAQIVSRPRRQAGKPIPARLSSGRRQKMVRRGPRGEEGLSRRSPQGEGGMGKLLARSFFEAAPELVAPRLLGKLLVHRTTAGILAGRIVEVEAYLGPHNHPPDPAAHARHGPTPRNQVLFGPPGHAYVYTIYGLHFCMNISCEKKGQAGSVLLRALEPLTGLDQMALNRGSSPDAPPRMLTSGPGRLCQALGITRSAHNGLDLLHPDSPLQVRDDGFSAPEVLITPRIGISAAVDLPLRFSFAGHKCVSGPSTLSAKPASLL